MADLLVRDGPADLALIGVPLGAGALAPGHCELAPAAVRSALKRMSSYDLETGTDLSMLRVVDMGDLPLPGSIEDAMEPISQAVRRMSGTRLAILLGGHNGITRAAVRGVDPTFRNVGLLTIDAHFDLRDTAAGLNNGNPVSALLEDGLPGECISQIGLLPFANTRQMHERARQAGISLFTRRDCRERGLTALVESELDRLSRKCDAIYVDFDIDAIDRTWIPGAAGARPGGLPVQDFFDAARLVGAHPRVKAVDLTEFDPALDVGSISALTAARWFCELLAGYSQRQ